MPRLASIVLVIALGAPALALASCGEEDAELLSGGTAREITANLDTVEQLADEGDCVGAESAAQQVSEQVEALEGVDPRLKRALEDGADRLNEVVGECEEPVESVPLPEPEEEAEVDEDEEQQRKDEEKEEKELERAEQEEEKADEGDDEDGGEDGGEDGSGEGPPPPLPPQAEGEGKGRGKGNGDAAGGGSEGGGTPSGGVSPSAPVDEGD
jgi:hypothetical protein